MDIRARLWIAQIEQDRQLRAAGLSVPVRHLVGSSHQQLLVTLTKTALVGFAIVSLGRKAAIFLVIPP